MDTYSIANLGLRKTLTNVIGVFLPFFEGNKIRRQSVRMFLVHLSKILEGCVLIVPKRFIRAHFLNGRNREVLQTSTNQTLSHGDTKYFGIRRP